MFARLFADLQIATHFDYWPNVPLNKNDSELQMFTSYYSIVDKNAVKESMQKFKNMAAKNRSESRLKRTQGNKFYDKKDYNEALRMYNESISLAPRESSEFALAVANRSAVLFSMEMYKECLEDTLIVLKSEYPSNLHYKIFIRQSRCFLRLNSNFKAAKALRKAQESFDKLNLKKEEKASVNKEIMDIKEELKENLSSSVSGDTISSYCILTEPTLKNGENPKFLNASKLVEIKHSKKQGEQIIAQSDIKMGDVLIIEEPYCHVSNNSEERKKIIICNSCLKKSCNFIPCSICSAVFYCSDNCRHDDWKFNHRWTCFGERCNIIMNLDQKMCLYLLFNATRDGFKTEIKDKSVYGDKENNHPFLNKLAKYKKSDEQLQSFIQAAVWLTIYLQNFTDYFEWLYLYPKRPEGSKEELVKFIGAQLVKYFLKMNSNITVIMDTFLEIDPDSYIKLKEYEVGCGIYLSSAVLKHSCVPNTTHSFCGKKRIVKALQNIKKGSEITINYLSEKFDSYADAAERKCELKIKFNYSCSCVACTDPDYEECRSIFLCPRCHGKSYAHEVYVQCTECSLCVNALPYLINEAQIKKLMGIFIFLEDADYLDCGYELIKKTYHKHSREYVEFCYISAKYYFKTGDIKKSLDRIKLCLEIAEIYYKNFDENHCLIVIFCTNVLATYCKLLKKQNSQNYEKYFDETKQMIQKSASILEYMVCADNIRAFFMDITKYLNSDYIDPRIDPEEENGLILEECE